MIDVSNFSIIRSIFFQLARGIRLVTVLSSASLITDFRLRDSNDRNVKHVFLNCNNYNNLEKSDMQRVEICCFAKTPV